jgi:protein TonB
LEAPTLIRRVEPEYPAQVRKERTHGEVKIRAVIAADGTVSDISIASSPSEILSRLAVEAVSQWRYKPAYCRDLAKPVRVYLTVTVTFSLDRP